MINQSILAMVAVAAAGAALPMSASASATGANTTHVVGSCAAGVHYTTIQSAVTATPNGTVFVCPGTYPEQVNDSTNTSIEGLTAANGSQPRIVVPAGGLKFNFVSYDNSTIIDAQILVVNATNVTISRLTVDGANNGVQDCGQTVNGTSYAEDPRGIDFEDSSGLIGSNYVINQANAAAYGGCQSGEAIWAEAYSNAASGQKVTISGNHVQDFQKNGITINNGLSATISGNTIVGQGATPLIAGNGIQVAYGATATVTNNTVSDEVYTGPNYGASGILVYDATVNSTDNTLYDTQYAIAYVGVSSDTLTNKPTISGNRITTTRAYDAIDLCGATGATIDGNYIAGTGEAAIHADSSCGPVSSITALTGNRINLACAAVLVGAGSSVPSGGSNTITNAATNVLTGSDVCPATTTDSTLLQRRHGATRSRFSPR